MVSVHRTISKKFFRVRTQRFEISKKIVISIYKRLCGDLLTHLSLQSRKYVIQKLEKNLHGVSPSG